MCYTLYNFYSIIKFSKCIPTSKYTQDDVIHRGGGMGGQGGGK